MKLAISSPDGKFDTEFSSRFGRCKYFVFVDTMTRDWEAKPNPAASARGGAGPQAIQFLSNNGVEATITGRYGPSAFTALEAAGMQAYIAAGGTVSEILEEFLAGELEQVTAATGHELHG